MMKQLFTLLLWLALLPGQGFAATISEVLFEGNEVTKETVLRQELLLREGDEVDLKLIEASRQAIMNLGLFKTVNSRLEEVGSSRQLIFTMEERYFLLPIPLIGARAKNGNAAEGLGSVSYGIELRYDNVMGLNQRMKLVYENEDFEDEGGSSNKEVSLGYDIPRVIGTPYQLNLKAKSVRREVEEFDESISTGSYRSDATSGGFYLSRWLNDDSISQGWSAGGGVGITTLEYGEQVGSGLTYLDSQTVAVTLGVNYGDVQEFPYHRRGQEYGYKFAVGLPELGSTSSFTQHELFFRSYRPMNFSDSNVNTQIQLNIANGEGATYSVGNTSLLRGYENDFSEGNAMLLINMEYHHHLSGYRQLRGVLFADMGNAWASALELDLGDVPVGVGVGLRWKVQSFVDVTFRLDYAQALGADTDKISLTTIASF